MLDKNDVYAEYIKTQIENTKRFENDKAALKEALKTIINNAKSEEADAEWRLLWYATIGIVYAEGLME